MLTDKVPKHKTLSIAKTIHLSITVDTIGQKLFSSCIWIETTFCNFTGFDKCDFLNSRGSVVGPVTQANWRLTFEDDVRSGGLLYFTTQFTNVCTGLAKSMVTLGEPNTVRPSDICIRWYCLRGGTFSWQDPVHSWQQILVRSWLKVYLFYYRIWQFKCDFLNDLTTVWRVL